jgi:hypothetical protein
MKEKKTPSESTAEDSEARAATIAAALGVWAADASMPGGWWRLGCPEGFAASEGNCGRFERF